MSQNAPATAPFNNNCVSSHNKQTTQAMNSSSTQEKPLVSCLSNDSLEGFKKYSRAKSAKCRIHFLSSFAEFVQEPKQEVVQVKQLDLDYFERVKKLANGFGMSGYKESVKSSTLTSKREQMSRQKKLSTGVKQNVGPSETDSKTPTNNRTAASILKSVQKGIQDFDNTLSQLKKNKNLSQENINTLANNESHNLKFTQVKTAKGPPPDGSSVNKTFLDHSINKNINFKKSRTTLYEQVHSRSKNLLLGFIKANEKKDIFVYVNGIIDQYQNKLSQLLSEFNEHKELVAKEKEQAERALIQKDLEIENLNSKHKNQAEELVLVKKQLLILQENGKVMKEFEKEYEQLKKEMPGMTCSKLMREYRKVETLCLGRLSEIEGEKYKKYEEQISSLSKEVGILNHEISRLKEANTMLSQQQEKRRMFQALNIDDTEIMQRAQKDLKQVQAKIFSLYNDWDGKRDDGDKVLLKELQGARTYTYEEMLDEIVYFKEKLSTDSKLKHYFRKVLASIQRLRRKIFPEDANSKLDPEKVLAQIQQFVCRCMISKGKIKKQLTNNSKGLRSPDTKVESSRNGLAQTKNITVISEDDHKYFT